MRLINDERDDLSLECLTIIGSVVAMTYASEIACERLSSVLDLQGIRGTLVQEKRRYINGASRAATALVHNLEAAFDQTMSEIICNDGADNIAERDNTLHGMGAEVLELVITFLAKTEGMEHDKRRNIFKMLNNFKDTGKVDLQALVKFFRFDG